MIIVIKVREGNSFIILVLDKRGKACVGVLTPELCLHAMNIVIHLSWSAHADWNCEGERLGVPGAEIVDGGAEVADSQRVGQPMSLCQL